MFYRIIAAIFVGVICFSANAQQKEQRVALVIGNSSYKSSPLKNPVNDARDMANSLRGYGFTVIERTNLTTRQVGQTLREFRSKLTPGSVTVVFYAGHGVQIKGENYLPTVDAEINGEEDVPMQSLSTRQVMDVLAEAKTRMNLVFLDACRDNPYARSFRSSTRGIAKENAPSGTLISFATRPGSVAGDGDGRNGLYTSVLLEQIKQSNQPIEQVLKRVVSGVKVASKGHQEPWMEGSIEGDFCFSSCGVNSVGAASDPDYEAWIVAQRVNTLSGYKAYLDAFPSGRYVSAAKIATSGAISNSANKPLTQTTSDAVATTTAVMALPNQSNNRVNDLIQNSQPLKIAFAYVGPVGDGGWTFAHDQGRKAIEREFGDRVQVSYVENVPESADAERVFRDLVKQGNKLIFGTTFGYMEPMLKVASGSKGVKFEHATGYKQSQNLRTYDSRTYEGAYLAGVIAGAMTKSNRLGVVASIPIPEVIRNINSFTLGAQSSNPKVKTSVIWVNEWFNPPKESEAAVRLINSGVDVLFQNTDSPAVLKTAQERGKRAFGLDSDMSLYGPKAHLGSAVTNWAPYYIKTTQDLLDGKWVTGSAWLGVKEGAIDLVSIASDVPIETKNRINQIKDGLRRGTFFIWKGPIFAQNGQQVLSNGETADDRFLAGMNFYVAGVEGRVPGAK
jgi:simple sugar transport system substrate-binding protein